MHAGTYKPCDNVMDARKQRAQLPLRELVTRIYGAAGAAGRSSPVWKHAVKTGSIQLLIRQMSVLIYVAAQRFFFFLHCCVV